MFAAIVVIAALRHAATTLLCINPDIGRELRKRARRQPSRSTIGHLIVCGDPARGGGKQPDQQSGSFHGNSLGRPETGDKLRSSKVTMLRELHALVGLLRVGEEGAGMP